VTGKPQGYTVDGPGSGFPTLLEVCYKIDEGIEVRLELIDTAHLVTEVKNRFE
jgi:hypothetical protein